MAEYRLPTEFTPRQLAELRQLVFEERSRYPHNDERGRELHNLGVRLDSYVRMADRASRATGTFG